MTGFRLAPRCDLAATRDAALRAVAFVLTAAFVTGALVFLPALVAGLSHSCAAVTPPTDRQPRANTLVLPAATARGCRLFDAHGNPARPQ